jgi:hypothetical protein
MHAVVHAADIQDRDGGVLLMGALFGDRVAWIKPSFINVIVGSNDASKSRNHLKKRASGVRCEFLSSRLQPLN